ncbi:hypothetical protein IH86_10980 [Sphingobium yanoikuyae]|uniref:Uncharacterized protein n=1 Tax=Sphingobium yanoikuyae TaxID=13690 RepID=A0A085K654_SPHYA|nr:hypothetical protein EBF16_18180 [Sphingobium yanoikuyae]KFD28200.1 hypothetical protein IH86_10980 [Sphingobium yanoikuyae]
MAILLYIMGATILRSTHSVEGKGVKALQGLNLPDSAGRARPTCLRVTCGDSRIFIFGRPVGRVSFLAIRPFSIGD